MYVPSTDPEKEIVEARGAEQYLASLIELRTRELYKKLARFDNVTGLKTEIVDGMVITRVADKGVYFHYLIAMGFKPHELQQRLNFEDNLTIDFLLQNVRENKAFLEKLARECIDLTEEHKGRVKGVPIGFGYTSLFEAGAIPVPQNGDVVLISLNIQLVRHWLAWLSFLLPIMQRDPEVSTIRYYANKLLDSLPFLVSKRKTKPTTYLSAAELRALLAALPDLARSIVKSVPYPGFTLFAELALPLLNNNSIGWPAEFAERFIILHELGHIALRHTDRIRAIIAEVHSSSQSEIIMAGHRRMFELEADRFAGHALRYFYPPEEAAKGLLGLFSLVYFSEENQDTDDTATHPPALERLKVATEAYLERKTDYIEEGPILTIVTLKHASDQIRKLDGR
jgi:hypothetical protein